MTEERYPNRRCAVRRWIAVGLWILLIYLTIPFARLLQSTVSDFAGRDAFLDITVYSIVIGCLAGIGLLLKARCSWKQIFVLCMVAGIYLYCSYNLLVAPEEALHFVQYGVLGIFLFRALSLHVRSPAVYVAAFVVGVGIGTLDEWIQWVTPRRFWDYRDVAINAFSVLLMQVAIAWGWRPESAEKAWDRKSLRLFALVSVPTIILLLLPLVLTPRTLYVISRVIPSVRYLSYNPSVLSEYGYLYSVNENTSFKSRLTEETLVQMDRARANEAAAILNEYSEGRHYRKFLTDYPPVRDPFIHEVRVHLARREHYQALFYEQEAGNTDSQYLATVAFREQLILEHSFSNTVQQSAFAIGPAVRRELAAAQNPDSTYLSAASQHLITGVSEKWAVPLLVVVIIALLLFGGYLLRKGCNVLSDG